MCSCRETPSRNLGQEGTQERRCKQWHHTMGTTEARNPHRHMESDSRWPGMLIPLSAVPEGAHKIWHPHQLPSQRRQLVHGDYDRRFSARKSANITAAACNWHQKYSSLEVGISWNEIVLLLHDLFACPNCYRQLPLLGAGRGCKVMWRSLVQLSAVVCSDCTDTQVLVVVHCFMIRT